MKLKKHQQGIGFLGILFVIVVVIVMAVVTVRIVPYYVENNTIKSILASLEDEPDLYRESVAKIMYLVTNRLAINGVKNVEREDIKVSKKNGLLTVSIQYEIRAHMVANIDALLTFNDKAEVISQ